MMMKKMQLDVEESTPASDMTGNHTISYGIRFLNVTRL